MTSHLTENKKNKNYKTTSTPGLLKCVFFYGGRSDIKKNKKQNAEVDGVMLLGQVTASKQAKKTRLDTVPFITDELMTHLVIAIQARNSRLELDGA